MEAKSRPLWTRKAETPEGNEILQEARYLSMDSKFSHLSDAELIRLAYWGSSGASDG